METDWATGWLLIVLFAAVKLFLVTAANADCSEALIMLSRDSATCSARGLISEYSTATMVIGATMGFAAAGSGPAPPALAAGPAGDFELFAENKVRAIRLTCASGEGLLTLSLRLASTGADERGGSTASSA